MADYALEAVGRVIRIEKRFRARLRPAMSQMSNPPVLSTSTERVRVEPSTASGGGPVGFIDRFPTDIRPGRVIGSTTGDGVRRKGVDRERVIGIDNGALRIEPLVKPGWGRSGIAYGPFPRENGLAFHTLILNGHNISRSEPLPDEFRMRLWRWAVGSEVETLLRRAVGWLKSGQKRHMWRRLRQWVRSGTGLFHWPLIEENLAVGWFSSEAPALPQRQGCSLIMHAIVPEGGELWARVGEGCLPTLRGIQNVPMHYAVVLRERGAAYYASSALGDVPGVSASPAMRPLAIDAFDSAGSVYAGIHQSVLGEIGFRADTRVFGAQVTRIPELSAWYGSAHGADSLTGEGPLASAEVGGQWRLYEGEFRRSDSGVTGLAAENSAVLRLDAPSGLVHLLIDCGEKPVEDIAVIWRWQDEDNFWCFAVGSSHGQLSIVENGRWFRHPAVRGRHLAPNTLSSLQVFDDGERIRVSLDGRMVYGTTLHDKRLQTATGVGFRIASPESNVTVRSFEAHPREINLPGTAEFEGPRVTRGDRVVVADTFEGPAGDLNNRTTTLGSSKWVRGIGQGVIELTGNRSAQVRGSSGKPCPGRTAYLIDWKNPGFADVQVTITPAGKRRKSGEKGRAGLILWQNDDEYTIVGTWVESWPAMSVSAFFKVGGFEELYDAVWTNVGDRIHWGEPHDFRVIFDGRTFVAFINREPVLQRALTDVYPRHRGFAIHRVGIVANWEWGNDTGSVFENFVGRDRR